MSAQTVLIVEDNPINVELYLAVLENTEYQAVAVDRAALVMETVLACQPTLILLDLTLPDGSGIAVATQLKSNPATSTIPLVALTALRREGLEDELQRAGFTGLMQKPCGVQDLLQTLKLLTDRPAQPDGFRVYC